ncbi:MAG: lipid-A-disaccharide synthase [Oricola sp.]
MTQGRQLVIGIVAGEQSGENLAVDLIDSIAARTGSLPQLVGVGGDRLAERGLKSVFDPSEIALMGISAVLVSVPRLLLRLRQTAQALIAARPDVIILIDSPEFSYRVAQRVKKALPYTPVIKYVAPSVWAWRPGRARAIARYIDHVLAILSFEPAVMEGLGGPKTTYIGHPLAMDAGLEAVWTARRERPPRKTGTQFDLLVLPGSRKGEIDGLLPDFEQAVGVLHERGHRFRILMPTLPRLAETLMQRTASWPVKPLITTSPADKIAAFRTADAALAASGTVLLELALAGVPVISCYRTDRIMRLAVSLVTTWTAALPNIIADRPIVPEYIDYLIRPGMLARRIEELVEENSGAAALQLSGFKTVRDLMVIAERPGSRAAAIVLDAVAKIPDSGQ